MVGSSRRSVHRSSSSAWSMCRFTRSTSACASQTSTACTACTSTCCGICSPEIGDQPCRRERDAEDQHPHGHREPKEPPVHHGALATPRQHLAYQLPHG